MGGTRASLTTPAAAAPRRWLRAARRVMQDPAATFLVIGALGGLVLTATVKPFDGIDETSHFFRSHQVSEGRLVPIRTDDDTFRGGGACVSGSFALEVRRQQAENLAEFLDVEVPDVDIADLAPCPEDPDDRDEVFVNFATFPSPLPYAPQAIAIATTRGLGGGPVAMLYTARLAGLAVYLAIVYLAIRRACRGAWVLCVIALVPAALFEAGASVSHDVFNLAVVLFVVSSALRMLDPDHRASMRTMLVEASTLSLVLVFCKPTYAIVACCYLLPALGERRRRELWLLAVPVGVALAASVLWNNAVDHLWATDADVFGVAVDEARQRDALLDAPWNFVRAVLRTSFEDAGDWLRDLVGSNPRYVEWWRPLQVLAVAGLGLVAIAPGDRDRRPLRSLQRVLLVGIFVVGSLLVFAAYWIYWTAPGSGVIGGLQIRYFLPLVPVLLIALAPGELGNRVWRAIRLPPGAVLLAIEAAVVLTAVSAVV